MAEVKTEFEIKLSKYYLGNSDRYIEFDDGDINLLYRFKEIHDDIAKYLAVYDKKIEKYKDKKDINDMFALLDIQKEADFYIKERIDYAFNSEVSKIAFGIASCLSLTEDGEYYFANFLNSIIMKIDKSFDIRFTKLSKKAERYANAKGTHPAYKK